MPRPALTQVEVDDFRETAAVAALDLIEEQGVDALTLRSLAAKLGCSYAKPYRYFRDKAHLIDAVRGLGFDRLGEYFAAVGAAGALTVETYLAFALANPETYRVMFALRQDYISPETRAAQARAWEICARPYHAAVAAGELEGDPDLIAHVAWSTMHGLVSLELANQLYLGKSLEEVAGAFGRVLDGFRPRTS